MVELVHHILPFVVPPLLGAIIGYVTNAIAIKMLFRPLTEVRVLGIRLPFTPGIIPRQRRQLAESIGRMVSTQLLNADTVRTHIATAAFKESIRNQIAGMTNHLLATPPAGSNDSDVTAIGTGLSGFLRGLFSRFIHSPSFDRVSHDFVRRGFQFLSGLSIHDLIPAAYRGTEAEIVAQLQPIVARILGDRAEGAITEAGVRWVQELLAENIRLNTVVSDELVSRLTLVVSRLYMPTVRAVLHWLSEDEVKSDLSVRGKDVLKHVFERLNFFQRFLVTAGQYDRSLEERMPQIIDDLIEAIREAAQSPETKARIIDGGSRWLQQLRERGLADVCDDGGIDLPGVARRAFAMVAGVVVGPGGQERIARLVYRAIDEHSGRSLIEVLRDVLGITEQSVHSWLDEKVFTLRDSPAAAGDALSVVSTLLSGLLEEVSTRPLGELLALTVEQKAAIDNFVSHRIYDIIDLKLPDVVEALDVQGLVEDKINALDILNVENLLLMIIEKQLKWINLFGGVLGALIGGVQVVIGLFG
ncbi:MAG TPA: DUF445 family protein [Spirochaetia bacterium]|nr:DUF445 family protein [Spirochaetia bacterium]